MNMTHKVTVLIIEDEKKILTFVSKILKKHDYKVLCADTGKGGLSLIGSQCPDIILLDLGLPDLDGCSIIQEVRAWSSIPIIVISARSAEKEKVAPDIVFSDLTLMEMAEKKPKNRWDMLKIRGIGNQKFKNYGEEFLKVINSFSDEDMEIIRLESIVEDKYLEESKLEDLKNKLQINISSEKLREILIKSLFS